MTQNIELRVVDFDEAIELGDWEGVALDLKFVCDACDKYLTIGHENPPLIGRSLWIAIMVTYSRCFKKYSGVRLGLDEDDLNGMEDGLSLHRYIIGLRDEHIGHSVSDYEQAVIGVAEIPGVLAAVEIFTQYMTDSTADTISKIKKMAQYLIQIAKGRADRAKTGVIAKFAELSDEHRRTLPVISHETPSVVRRELQVREGLKRRQRRNRSSDGR